MSLILDGSLGVTVDAGTAALPAVVSATGTADTGLWFPAADTVAASTAGTERMRIDSSGNVGIGTTSPTAKLQVNGSMTMATANWFSYGTDNTFYSDSSYGLVIKAPATSNFIAFRSSNDTERLRIDSSGNVLVGTTSTPAQNVKGIYLSIGGQQSYQKLSHGTLTTAAEYFYFYNGNGQVGSISSNGSTTSYTTSSDYRLKNTIAPMTGALAKVALLKPVTYKWNADDSDGEGFIAHELAEVCHYAVSGEKDGVDAEGKPQYQGIDVSFLVATLTASIQELKAIIDTQAAQIAALNAKVGI